MNSHATKQTGSRLARTQFTPRPASASVVTLTLRPLPATATAVPQKPSEAELPDVDAVVAQARASRRVYLRQLARLAMRAVHTWFASHDMDRLERHYSQAQNMTELESRMRAANAGCRWPFNGIAQDQE